MVKKSVVNKEYQNLNKTIVDLQEKWKNSLREEAVLPKVDKAALDAGVPVIALTDFHFDISLFLQWIEEVVEVLIASNDELAVKLNKLSDIMNEEVGQRWIQEALSFNQAYFADFAEEKGLEEWIPSYFAETAVRPFLQLLAESVQDRIEYAVPGEGCPVCGEPVRLAALEEEGKKVVHCPRCLAHWQGKRLECDHCGNDDHQKLKFLTIEGDAISQIQVCEVCNRYMKVIDTRQYITKPSAAQIDLDTIHLDFVAQQNGYRAVGEKKTTN
jgi:FdhE protein